MNQISTEISAERNNKLLILNILKTVLLRLTLAGFGVYLVRIITWLLNQATLLILTIIMLYYQLHQ